MSRGRHAALLALVAAIAACRDARRIEQDARNAAPRANAGTGSSYPLRTTVMLDGGASFDPDGEIVTYRWRIVSAPSGTGARILAPDAPRVAVTLDLPGLYIFELGVTDDAGATSASRLLLEATPPALTATAGPDRAVPWLGRARLAGAVAVDGPDAATFTWELVERPPSSLAVLEDTTTLTPTLLTDEEGTYRVRLVASTGWTSVTDEVVVTSSSTPRFLDRGGELFTYAPAIDRILVFWWQTGALGILAPGTGGEISVPLPETFEPYELVVAPDGARAALTDGAEIVIVDLDAAAIEQTLTLPYPQPRLAFGPDGRLHVLRSEGADVPLAVIDLAAQQTTEAAYADPVGAVAFRPGTAALYVLDGFGGALRRFDASGAAPVLERVAEDTGGFPEPPVLISEDGAALVLGSGQLFRLADDAAADLVFIQDIAPGLVSLTHSAATNSLALVTYDGSQYPPTRLRVLDATTLAVRADATIPRPGTGADVPQLVAYDASGARLYLVVGWLGTTFIYDLEAP